MLKMVAAIAQLNYAYPNRLLGQSFVIVRGKFSKLAPNLFGNKARTTGHISRIEKYAIADESPLCSPLKKGEDGFCCVMS